MNIPALAKIQDPIAKAIIIDLTQRLEKLEQKQQSTPAIGFHQNASTSSVDIAFPNRRKAVGD
ncbi:hypothetical protein LOZ80_26020 [Paenibacillus sp. HWE-109]|uniref:hypothetical protein n=1 Tax=Paenibacillus sp. HWE-109 TaxID=1306526 RepID=UPI001EDD88C0|nr:hypothetical protein [Paenibacillus sp. HWE-109]UKS25038.1 hypothetical protein LOZ80_26020 [Paenibacillus sp. HWE-109]